MGVSKMDLFVRDYQSGAMPKDYYEQSIIVPKVSVLTLAK